MRRAHLRISPQPNGRRGYTTFEGMAGRARSLLDHDSEDSKVDDVFTEYVRCLAAGEELDQASHDEVWEYLRLLLVRELRRRGLWTAPTAYVGVVAQSWREAGALEELTADAFAFCILDRLQGLANQLRVRDNIRGLIVLNVRNFVTDRQRKADPLGFLVFGRLRRAIEGLVAKGRLFVRTLARRSRPTSTEQAKQPGPPRVDNGSVLDFGRFPSPVADIDALQPHAAAWNDELMPELVTGGGLAAQSVVARLGQCVAGLAKDGIQAFPLQSLAKALKDDARARWSTLWEQPQDRLPEDGEPGAPEVPVVRPDEVPDEHRFRATVLACVERMIGAVRQPKRQRDLWTVWLFLRATRIDNPNPRALPSFTRVGEALGLNRERVAQLLRQLEAWVRRCLSCGGREAQSAPAAERPKNSPKQEAAELVALGARDARSTR